MDQLKKHYTPEELETILNFLTDYETITATSKDEQTTLRKIQDDVSKLLVGF